MVMVIISCITFSKYRLARNKTLMSQPFYRGVVIIQSYETSFGPKSITEVQLGQTIGHFFNDTVAFLG